jgi:homoserine kinase type II
LRKAFFVNRPFDVQVDVRQVLEHYKSAARPEQIEPVGSAGGFSGSLLWRVHDPQGVLCLRRWPTPHPSRVRIEWIHQVMAHAWQHGFRCLPLPLHTASHATLVEHAGHLWELTPWMPGDAAFESAPSGDRLRAAATTLARFHLTVGDFPGIVTRHGPSPGLFERRQRFEFLTAGGFERLVRSATDDVWPPLMQRALRILESYGRLGCRTALETAAAAQQPVFLQPCLRDIHSDHVLFDQAKVTAFVDFGAMRVDTVATDLARMLGSMARDDPAWWQLGLAAYESVRPLADEERRLVVPFDRAAVVLSGLNWLEWIYVERRRFENREAVLRRIDRLIERLNRLEAGFHPLDTTRPETE